MIEDFLGGVIDAIIVWDVDRFTRQTYELELLLRAVEEKAVAGSRTRRANTISATGTIRTFFGTRS
jgi:DNA invertase Pin-like site-specific DNA recombinase